MIGRATHTYALLEVSAATHAEIKRLFFEAGYDDHLSDDDEHGTVIDMSGVALVVERPAPGVAAPGAAATPEDDEDTAP